MLRMLHDVSLTFMQTFKPDKVTKFCGALPTKSISLRLSQRLRQAFSVHSTFHAARKVQSGNEGQGGILKKSYRHLVRNFTQSRPKNGIRFRSTQVIGKLTSSYGRSVTTFLRKVVKTLIKGFYIYQVKISAQSLHSEPPWPRQLTRKLVVDRKQRFMNCSNVFRAVLPAILSTHALVARRLSREMSCISCASTRFPARTFQNSRLSLPGRAQPRSQTRGYRNELPDYDGPVVDLEDLLSHFVEPTLQ
jgi:hypothetical protein